MNCKQLFVQGTGAQAMRDRNATPPAVVAIACAILVALLSTAQRSHAQAPVVPEAKGATGFAVKRHVIASGGGSSSGGNFVVRGTIAQVDADPLQPASGGVFAITGGFWPGMDSGESDLLFKDGFETP